MAAGCLAEEEKSIKSGRPYNLCQHREAVHKFFTICFIPFSNCPTSQLFVELTVFCFICIVFITNFFLGIYNTLFCFLCLCSIHRCFTIFGLFLRTLFPLLLPAISVFFSKNEISQLPFSCFSSFVSALQFD